MNVSLGDNFSHDKHHPDRIIPKLGSDLFIKYNELSNDCQLTIKRASNDSLNVFGGDKKEVEHIVQETWESAGEWFY
ncbi:TPA: DinI-like family protein [Enterobacter roggenkampii]|nr:DinI-like family protein [Enterobacter roggenkampii]HDS4671795.1 DinI-like family protein [Enterobacter roggenkampii]HDS5523959.1 DinI-like family protein [Enterobacter roggenkampii]HDT1059937.1 DinI-like family protein [Enterobacter roggenkampii]